MEASDPAPYVRQSTQSQVIPERLSDHDTLVAVVRLLKLASESRSCWGQRHTLASGSDRDNQVGQ